MALFDKGSVHMSAKTEYALRATVELAGVGPAGSLTAHAISAAQTIPLRFLLNILADLRRVGLVDSRRGPSGGWRLARPADLITVADVIRGVDGPLAPIATVDPDDATVAPIMLSLNEMWGAVRLSIRDVLEQVTIADLASGQLPHTIPRPSAPAE